MEQLVPLSSTTKGQKVILQEIIGGHQLRQRLSAMGLIPGTDFLVVSNGHPGPFVLKIKESKIVLGRGMANQIKVRVVNRCNNE